MDRSIGTRSYPSHRRDELTGELCESAGVSADLAVALPADGTIGRNVVSPEERLDAGAFSSWLDSIGDTGILNGVSCTTPGNCTAVGNDGSDTGTPLVIREIKGVWHSGFDIDDPSASGFDGVSCPSLTSCVAVGAEGADNSKPLSPTQDEQCPRGSARFDGEVRTRTAQAAISAEAVREGRTTERKNSIQVEAGGRVPPTAAAPGAEQRARTTAVAI